MVRYIVAYHKKMCFELGVFDWVKTRICYSMQYIDSVFPNSCSIIILNYLCNKYDYCKYEGGADKSLARPGRKQATATKLRIYSTYSPRSSIHFLASSVALTFARYSKKIQKVDHPTRSLRQRCPPRRTKNGDVSIVFSVQGTGGSLTGPDPENSVSDQDTGSPGRPVSSGLQVPGELGHCPARTGPPC